MREHVVAIESKWVSASFDPAMEDLRKALEDARRFLTKSNLSQFLHMGLDSDDQAVIRKSISSLPHSYEAHGT